MLGFNGIPGQDSQQKRNPTVGIILGVIVLGLVVFAISIFVWAISLHARYLGELLHNLTGGGSGVGGGASQDCSGVSSVSAEYLPWVKDASGKWLKGDEAALIALIQIESGWDPGIKNRTSSATGLGQFLTTTAQDFPEFVGGDDTKGISWPVGQVFATANSNDARLDPKRSIYAAAHLLSTIMTRYGSLGDAYDKGYHTGALHPGTSQAAEAAKGRARLEEAYQKLKDGGGCTSTDSQENYSSGGITVGSGSWLKVPGVEEATKGDCGQASVLMVARFYNPRFSDPEFYDAVNNQTRDNKLCVTPMYLNRETPYKDWDFDNSIPSVGMANVKRSLASGDPVVFYSSPGTIYSSQHIFVIAGYDPNDQTYYVNNPFVHGCDCYPSSGPTKTPNGKKMTEAWLSQHFGGRNGPYTHTFIIRKKYVQ